MYRSVKVVLRIFKDLTCADRTGQSTCTDRVPSKCIDRAQSTCTDRAQSTCIDRAQST